MLILLLTFTACAAIATTMAKIIIPVTIIFLPFLNLLNGAFSCGSCYPVMCLYLFDIAKVRRFFGFGNGKCIKGQ